MEEKRSRHNVSILDKAWQALTDIGVTDRKKGEKISEIILEKYPPKD